MKENRKEFSTLVISSTISQIGSHFLTLSLAAYTLEITGSALKASYILVFTYLPPALVGLWISKYIERHASKKLLIYLDVLAAIISVYCGYCVVEQTQLVFLVLGLSFRSILSLMHKSIITKWIKTISSPKLHASRFEVYLLMFFFSTGVSGILAATSFETLGIKGTILVDVLTFLLAILVYLPLKNRQLSFDTTNTKNKGKETIIKILRKDPKIFFSFLSIILSQGLFQGAYLVFVTFLPQIKFELSPSGTGYYQVSATIGILVGWFICHKKIIEFYKTSSSKSKFILVLSIAICSTIYALKTPVLYLSLVCFFMLNLTFEVIWLNSSTYNFVKIPQSLSATIQYYQNSIGSTSMATMAMLYSFSADKGELNDMLPQLLIPIGLIWVVFLITIESKSDG